MVLLYDALGAGDVVVRHWIPTTTVLRAAFDAVRLAADDREAVVILDVMAAAGCCLCDGWRRTSTPARARQVWSPTGTLSAASEHSRSPNEVRLRLLWEKDAGLPHVHVNCPVHDLAGRLLGIADLLDEEAGLAVEFDGADHRRARLHSDDIRREGGSGGTASR